MQSLKSMPYDLLIARSQKLIKEISPTKPLIYDTPKHQLSFKFKNPTVSYLQPKGRK